MIVFACSRGMRTKTNTWSYFTCSLQKYEIIEYLSPYVIIPPLLSTHTHLCAVDVKRHWLFAEPPLTQVHSTMTTINATKKEVLGVVHRRSSKVVVRLHGLGAHVVQEPPREGHLRRQRPTADDELERSAPAHLEF